MNLECDFTVKEITRALHQMHPNKAPELDGMSPIPKIFGDSRLNIYCNSFKSPILRLVPYIA